MSGTVKERSAWLVAVAAYLYGKEVILRCDILSDTRTQDFELAVPELDWADIRKSYETGNCNLADAQAFVSAWHEVLGVIKLAKRDGFYTSRAWREGAGA